MPKCWSVSNGGGGICTTYWLQIIENKILFIVNKTLSLHDKAKSYNILLIDMNF